MNLVPENLEALYISHFSVLLVLITHIYRGDIP